MLRNISCSGPLPRDREIYYRGELWVDEVDAEWMTFSVGGGGPAGWYMFFWALTFYPGLVFSISAGLGWLIRIWHHKSAPSVAYAWGIGGLALCAVGYLLKYLAQNASSSSSAHLSRAEGQLILPRNRRPDLRFDFEDIDGYIADVIAPGGARHHELHLYTVDPRTRERRKLIPLQLASTYSGDDVMALWSFLCQYMDKRRPLPNRPELWPAIMASLSPRLRTGQQRKDAEDAMFVDYCRRMREAGSTRDDLGVPPEYDPASPAFAYPHLLNQGG